MPMLRRRRLAAEHDETPRRARWRAGAGIAGMWQTLLNVATFGRNVGLGWLGRWADALTVYQQVAEARERVLGMDHPDALAGRNDEAHCLEQLGRHEEAVELYRRVAALRQQRDPHSG